MRLSISPCILYVHVRVHACVWHVYFSDSIYAYTRTPNPIIVLYYCPVFTREQETTP